MLALDFINIGNGDSILIREMENGEQKFAMMMDFGHDHLLRDDHPNELDPRSARIYAGDFLKKNGVTHLDVAIATHYHRDHIGGLNRVLQAVTVGEFMATYFPPKDGGELEPDNNDLPRAAKNLIRCVNMYAQAFYQNPGKVEKFTLLPGDQMETFQLTPDLKMELMFGEPALYPRQKEIYDAMFRGENSAYDLLHWGKSLNVSSLRARLYYHGKEIVLGVTVNFHTPRLSLERRKRVFIDFVGVDQVAYTSFGRIIGKIGTDAHIGITIQGFQNGQLVTAIPIQDTGDSGGKVGAIGLKGAG